MSVADEQFIDDGGLSSEVICVEAAPEGRTPQALWVRVGPVFSPEGERSEPGVWITYQVGYYETDMAGPVLLSPAKWRELAEAVEWRLREKGFPGA